MASCFTLPNFTVGSIHMRCFCGKLWTSARKESSQSFWLFDIHSSLFNGSVKVHITCSNRKRDTPGEPSVGLMWDWSEHDVPRQKVITLFFGDGKRVSMIIYVHPFPPKKMTPHGVGDLVEVVQVAHDASHPKTSLASSSLVVLSPPSLRQSPQVVSALV